MPITTVTDSVTPDTSNPATMPTAVARPAVDPMSGQNNLAPTTGQLWPRITQK